MPRSVGSGVRKPLVVGLLACLLAAMSGGASFAFSSPLFCSGDEAAHVDYAYQVWTGSLPQFSAGLVIAPGFGFIPPVQWVAQHPPLYYLIQAPVVGPLIDSGHYLAAGYAARAVNGLLAAAVVAAVAWAAAQAFPRRPQLWLAAALVTAVNPWVVRVAGAVYNDMLGALWATLLLGLTIRSLHHGRTLRRDVLLTLTAAAAIATRASLVLVVAICLGVLVIHSALSSRSWQRAVAATGRCALMGLAALVPIAWFYLRNERLTGHLLGSQPAWTQAHLHRTLRSTMDVLTDSRSWRALTGMFTYGIWDLDLMMRLLVWIPLGCAVVAALLIRRRTGRRASLATAMTFVLLAVTAMGTIALQLRYAAGGGALNPRYLLPVVLAISLAVAYGLSQLPAAGFLLLAPWTCLVVVDMIREVARYVATGPIRGATPYPVAAWASVTLCVVAVTVALGSQLAIRRASMRAARRAARRPVNPGSRPLPISAGGHGEGTVSA